MSPITEVTEGYSPAFHRSLNIRMGFDDEGAGVAWVDVDREVHWGARWTHGGVAASLADIASGLAIAHAVPNAQDRIDGTVELKINFLRKVDEGDLTATARLLHLGKRIAVTDIAVTNRGDLVAKALATTMLRPPS